jgi:hypothetical protein
MSTTASRGCNRVTMVARALACAAGFWLATAALEPRAASACSCLPPSWQGGVQPPQGGSAPRNTRIWVTYQRGEMSAPSVQLFDRDGKLVPAERSEIAFGLAGKTPAAVIVLTPRELLEPNQDYRYDVSGLAGRDQPLRIGFMASDQLDEQPPAVPTIAFQDLGNGQEDTGGVEPCVVEPWLALSLDAEAWIVRRSPLATGTDASLDTEGLSGSVEDFFADGRDGGFEIAYGAPCAAPWDGQPLSMQFASFDLAGNFSGWSATERFVPPGSTPADQWSGCSVRDGSRGASPGLEAPWLTAFALLLTWRLRRLGG